MSTVKIVGVIGTSVLARGEEAEVERTDVIDALLRDGYAAEVGTPEAARVPVEEAAPEFDPNDAPNRNAKREVWLEWNRRAGIEEPDDADRETLLADWDEYKAALADGS